jgi:hypothetical protein
MQNLADLLNGPIGIWVAAILTIMVYSYLLGDNPLYGLAEHLLVGSAAAYAVIVAIHSVLIPRLIVPLKSGNWLYIIPLVLGVLLLTKIKASWAPMGNISMGLLMGVGVALAVSGALLGTIWPQVAGTIMPLKPSAYPDRGWVGVVEAVIIIVGTIGALLYFHFSAGTPSRVGRLWAGLVGGWAKVGHWAIMIAFGAIFASLVMSRVSLLVGRMQFLLGDWLHLINLP